MSTSFYLFKGAPVLMYWMLMINMWVLLSVMYYLMSDNGLMMFNYTLFNIVINICSGMMVLMVLLMSSFVLKVSMNYVSMIESKVFLMLMSIFMLAMMLFVLSNSLLMMFTNWELMGLISYMLMNFWSSSVNCGMKAMMFNKIGDMFFLLFMMVLYKYLFPSALGFNSGVLPIFTCTLFNYSSSFKVYYYFAIGFMFMFFTKSAVFPFSSWLLFAMAAPTPMSALLHSSTMVMVGVYMGLVLNSTTNMLTKNYEWFLMMLSLFPMYSLNWSLLSAMFGYDFKGMIANSTISQMSYMFNSLYTLPMFTMLYMLIHSLFKSLLFLMMGGLIHVQANKQTIYKLCSLFSLMMVMYFTGSIMLVTSMSKEYIMYSSFSEWSSSFIGMMSMIGALLTFTYSMLVFICII